MVFSGYLLGGSSFLIEAKGDPMIETEDQRRWWFATHPEYSWSRRGIRSEGKVDPRDVDKYVDEALKYEKGPVADLLKSVKRNFGTEAYHNEHNQQPKEPQETIGPPKPPDLSDRARYVLDIVCPGLTKAYDRWRTGYYKAYPWAPGPLYDALPDLMSLVPIGLAKIQAALAKAVNPVEIAALQTARQELLKIWDLANFPRGSAMEDHLGRNLPRTFKGIDWFENGVARSNKSMHLGMKSYQDPAKILSQGRKYIDQVANFNGARMKDTIITDKDISERVLRVGVPPGATGAQKSALKSLIEYGKQNGVKVEVFRVPRP
jgi:hypothetical protein